ncbi:hypothetical protein [Actinomadura chokoriensis]|uniref:WXG100 family type VII secretion target n=1 Tax=Actinomadura chokoriensis TaxID=454156 RepID=A0ABV4R7C4_9ACTN
MGHPKSLPTTGGKEIKINHDTLDDIVKKLEKDLRDLKSQRYGDKIEDGTPPESAMGDYQAGRGLYSTVTAARDQIGGTYDQFLTAYAQVIEAIRASGKNHKKADDASELGVKAAGSPHTAI